MAKFTVAGPFEVPFTKRKVGRTISPANAKAFWASRPGVAKARGCYVFAFRAAKGMKPVYVGKATKTFEQEVFTDHKRNKYNDALADQAKGTPILFFVQLATTAGQVNKLAIDEAESHLIQLGLKANSKLANDKKTKVPSWSIAGVVRSGTGRPSKAAEKLRTCLKVE